MFTKLYGKEDSRFAVVIILVQILFWGCKAYSPNFSQGFSQNYTKALGGKIVSKSIALSLLLFFLLRFHIFSFIFCLPVGYFFLHEIQHILVLSIRPSIVSFNTLTATLGFPKTTLGATISQFLLTIKN